uniref:Uncharacterized protein n=2 Tax=Clastoptera arizonana TaxID=38151 RepID=A0A1B6DF05_9HEMI
MVMSVILEDPNEFKKNPLYKDREFGDFTAFYITISICSLFAIILFVFNIFFCWCSKYRDYWVDSNTGNRWILPIWVKTPYQQPPLDLSEFEKGYGVSRSVYDTEIPEEYVELHKRESDL